MGREISPRLSAWRNACFPCRCSQSCAGNRSSGWQKRLRRFLRMEDEGCGGVNIMTTPQARRKRERMEAHQESTKAASRPTRQRQQLHSAVVQDTTEFASFREEWDELYQSCPSATPF